MPVVGVPHNPVAPNVPAALLAAAERAGVGTRVVDLATLVVETAAGGTVVADAGGVVQVSHLAPALLYWQDAAAVALEAGEDAGWRCLNAVAATRTADDKGATAVALARAGLPQLRTVVAPQDLAICRTVAADLGYPVVVKRVHGAQGRWVRLAASDGELDHVLEEFRAEGRGAVVVQELCTEAAGTSLRVICTGGRVVAATERNAAPGELRSNVSAGGSQRSVALRPEEAWLAVRATAATGLGHAGVDLLRTRGGPVVLEVNACPDFTSMTPYLDVDVDVAAVVVAELLARPR